MKILHLADLHFGKLLYGVSMVENKDQRFWVDQMLLSVKEEKPDVVVIAGDVYDRGVPPKEAVELLDYCLTELVKITKKVLVVAGNHDSGERLSFASGLLEKQGLVIAGKVKAKMECVTISDEYGPVNFWLMPYVFPAVIKVALGDQEKEQGESNTNPFASYDLAVRTYLAAQEIDVTKRNILVAHQLVTNNGIEPQKSGSETLVGGVGQIDHTAFDAFDYVALGHIHGAQSVGRKTIRYAGAPLCYHFDEIKQKKGLLYINISDKAEEITMETREIPMLHPMRQIEDSYASIVSLESVNEAGNEYIRVILTDETLPMDARASLKSLFEGKGSILMDLSRNIHHVDTKKDKAGKNSYQEKSIQEHFLDFYEQRTDGELPDELELDLIRFVSEKTYDSMNRMEDRDSLLKKDVDELVEYCLKQEEKS